MPRRAAYCRQVPDVSADADPYTGYAIYWNGSWWSIGGTERGRAAVERAVEPHQRLERLRVEPHRFRRPGPLRRRRQRPGRLPRRHRREQRLHRHQRRPVPRPGGIRHGDRPRHARRATCPPRCAARPAPGPVQISSASSALFGLGTAGSFTVDASGNPTPAITESGPLPDGIVFTAYPNGTASLSGPPSASGVFPVVFTATDGTSTATQEFTLQVGTAPVITSVSTAVFRTGVKSAFQMTATGTPSPTFSVLSGTLPAGLVLSSTGKLVGTPGAGTSGSYPVRVQAANGLVPAATQTFTVVVDGAPTFTSSSRASFATGVRGSFTVTTSAAPVAVLSETGSLVPGLTFTATAGGRAVMAGTPTVAGLFSVAVRAANADGSTVQTLTVDVATHTQAVGFTSAPSVRLIVAVWSAFQFHATGLQAPTFSIVSGALPPEPGVAGYVPALTLTSTGLLRGWPFWDTGGVYHVVVEANNGTSPPAYQNFTITLVQPAQIAPAPTDGVSFAQSPTAVGTTEAAADLVLGQPAHVMVRSTAFPAATFSENGTLPPGTTLTDNGDGSATVSGTPTAAGTFYVFIAASNAVGGSSMLFALSVAPAVAPSFVSPSNATIPLGSASGSRCFPVTATGYPTPKLTETGAAPAGWVLQIDADVTVWIPIPQSSATSAPQGRVSSPSPPRTAPGRRRRTSPCPPVPSDHRRTAGRARRSSRRASTTPSISARPPTAATSTVPRRSFRRASRCCGLRTRCTGS